MGKKKCSPVILINAKHKRSPKLEKVYCSTGPVGISGNTGVVGVTGLRGITGFTGTNGGLGVTGGFGITGDVGVSGPRGEIGFCCLGVTGEIGFTGQKGQQELGLTGPVGVMGVCCENTTGPTGEAGFPGILTSNCTGCTAPIFVGNTVFVDAVFGSSEGQRERFDLPFQTLEDASSAALPGDLIIVRPGTYDPSSSVSKDGVNWYFEEGAIVNNPTMMIFGSGTYDITGYGYLNVMMTRNNGILTANYVNTLTVPGGTVIVNVKLMNTINVTGGILQGTVNELSRINGTASLLANNAGTVQLTIDNITYSSTISSLTELELIANSGETELIVENVSILAGPQFVNQVFLTQSGNFSLIFNQIIIASDVVVGAVFEIEGGNVNVIGTSIVSLTTLMNNAIFDLNTDNSTLTVNVNMIQVTFGTIFYNNNTSSDVTIRGDLHIVTGSTNSFPFVYGNTSGSQGITVIDVKNIVYFPSNEVNHLVSLQHGTMYIISQNITINTQLYSISGGNLYSRIQTAITTTTVLTHQGAIYITDANGPSKLVLHGGYRTTQADTPIVYIDTSGDTRNPSTVVMRGVTLQTDVLSLTPTIATDTTTRTVYIQNHGLIAANNQPGSNIAFLFGSANPSPSFSGYGYDPNVTI